MAMQRKLLFSLSDKTDGHEVTPETVPLGLLKDFVSDVAKFIRGSDRSIDPNDLLVSVAKGSLVLESYEELPANIPIWGDIEELAKGKLDSVDKKRADIAEKWLLDALKNPSRTFKIIDNANNQTVLINSNSYFTKDSNSNWVIVERYLSGTVADWGGVTSANIHFILEDGKTLKIEATREQIKEHKLNPVYHTMTIRVELEEELVTGKRRNAKFLGFADYQPQINEEDYRRATETGLAAWKDIEDAAEWVRKIRGGKE